MIMGYNMDGRRISSTGRAQVSYAWGSGFDSQVRHLLLRIQDSANILFESGHDSRG